MSAGAPPRATGHARLVGRLVLVTLVMFGFGYLLVPVYEWVCDITGFNGRTGRIEAAAVTGDAAADPASARSVKVQFVTNVNGDLAWDFEAEQWTMRVQPGRVYEATFRVHNRAERAIVGQAVPSVAPIRAAAHFNKTECFCFTSQRLEAGETREMPVRFVVDERLPRPVRELTLSYTFFEAQGSG